MASEQAKEGEKEEGTHGRQIKETVSDYYRIAPTREYREDDEPSLPPDIPLWPSMVSMPTRIE